MKNNMNNNYQGTGRRKEAVARVRLEEGTGRSQVRTKRDSPVLKKIKNEIAEAEKSLRRLNLILSKQPDEKTKKTSSVVKFETEEKLIELKKQFREEKKDPYKR